MTPEEKIAAAREKAAARKKLIAERAAAFAALPEEQRNHIDSLCQVLRNAFGESADWKVWGEPMLPWEELPEANRQNWRAVIGVAYKIIVAAM